MATPGPTTDHRTRSLVRQVAIAAAVVVVVGLAVVLVGRGGDGADTGSTEPSTTTPGPDSDITTVGTLEPDTLERFAPAPTAPTTVLGKLLAEQDADGGLPLAAALQAFVGTVGPVPGVTPPSGDVGEIDGLARVFARLAVAADAGELTPDQAAAIAAGRRVLLDGPAIDLDTGSISPRVWPEPGVLPGTTTTPDAAPAAESSRGAAVQPVAYHQTPPVERVPCGEDRGEVTPAQEAQLATIRADATRLRNRIAEETGYRIDVPIVIGFTNTQACTGRFGQTLANTGSDGDDAGRSIGCDIRLFPQFTGAGGGTPMSEPEYSNTLAHELFHCFQQASVAIPHYNELLNRAPWLIEGGAAWVGAAAMPDGAPERSYRGWFSHDEKGLFDRVYDGVGFFGHLADINVNPWNLLLPMLETDGREAAVERALGGGRSDFLDSLGSSHLLDRSRGGWFTMRDTHVPTGSTQLVEPILNGRVSLYIQLTKPYAFQYGGLVPIEPILYIQQSGGHLRLNDGVGGEFVTHSDAAYCVADNCECPAGTTYAGPPISGSLAGSIALGFASDDQPAQVVFDGMSLRELCIAPPAVATVAPLCPALAAAVERFRSPRFPAEENYRIVDSSDGFRTQLDSHGREIQVPFHTETRLGTIGLEPNAGTVLDCFHQYLTDFDLQRNASGGG